MRKHSRKLSPFFAGVLCTLLVCSMTITAMAATGVISFSVVNISMNGAKIASKGDTYTVANGSKIPYSLSYTDDFGGDTTYLPVRKISELLDIPITWDGATNTVIIGETSTTPQVTYYAKHPTVPDFGAATGAQLMSVRTSSATSTMYLYNMSQLNETSLNNYVTLLQTNGFSYIGAFNGSSGKILNYKNANTSVSLGIMSGYYAVMVSQ